jgi:hypothetical protein
LDESRGFFSGERGNLCHDCHDRSKAVRAESNGKFRRATGSRQALGLSRINAVGIYHR